MGLGLLSCLRCVSDAVTYPVSVAVMDNISALITVDTGAADRCGNMQVYGDE